MSSTSAIQNTLQPHRLEALRLCNPISRAIAITASSPACPDFRTRRASEQQFLLANLLHAARTFFITRPPEFHIRSRRRLLRPIERTPRLLGHPEALPRASWDPPNAHRVKKAPGREPPGPCAAVPRHYELTVYLAASHTACEYAALPGSFLITGESPPASSTLTVRS